MIMGYESRILNLHYDHAKVIANALNIDCSLLMDEYTNFCKPGYGKRIKTIRSQYGISQQEFADMIGCLRSTESIWEDEINHNHPNREKYQKIKELAVGIGLDIAILIENPEHYVDEYKAFIEHDCGKKIRQIRLGHGLVPKEFAQKIGCDWQTLVHWELNCARPLRKYYESLRQAAEEIGIDLNLLNDNPDYFDSDYIGFVSEDCGKKIRSIRNACGCGVGEFGKILGCTGEAVSKWEQNLCVPKLKYYKTIEQVAMDKGIAISRLNQTPELVQDEYQLFCHTEYGTTVRTVRQLYQMKQADFGKMIGVTVSTIRNWETARVIPDREHFGKLKEAAIRKGVNIYDA